MNLGDRLCELRRNKKLTQDEVAEKLNVTRQTVSKWETNLSTPDFDKIVPLCELYDITPNELLKGEKEGYGESNKEQNWEDAKSHIFTRGKDDEDNYENMTNNQIKQKSAQVVSTSVFIYIAAVAFLMVAIPVWNLNPVIATAIFLLLVGVGTARIIKHFMSIPKREKTKEEIKQNQVMKEIKDIIGAIGVTIYFIVSFVTMAWHITWVIFIIVGIAEQIVRLIFMLKEDEEDEK